ncbi:bone morphogenetic protein 4-like, partial [Lampetra planeri]
RPRQVQSWVSDRSSNHGLLVTVDNLSHGHAERGDGPAGRPPWPDRGDTLKFVSGKDRQAGREPMLVVFSDDGRRSAFGRNPGHDYELPGDADSADALRRLSRARRNLPKPSTSSTSSSSSVDSPARPQAPKPPPASSSSSSSEGSGPCRRHPMYVDFQEVGWSGWVISPRGYNAYSCAGACPFPLGHALRPTNHATVQSVVRALRPAAVAGGGRGSSVRAPCCVPDELYSINLLYYDEAGNVVLKQYDDMVAVSCGCH